MDNITFKMIRNYISQIDCVSICMKETLNYYNFDYIYEVPESFDSYYVIGIGMIVSEFPIDEDNQKFKENRKVDPNLLEVTTKGIRYQLKNCIEIMISDKPKF